jgi:hypothetical protein
MDPVIAPGNISAGSCISPNFLYGLKKEYPLATSQKYVSTKGRDIMLEFIKNRRISKARQLELDAKAPKAGDTAPDFELKDVHGETSARLSDFQGQKPVALIFGSFT